MSAAVAHNAGADSAVEGLIDLDTLQGELDSARGQVEMGARVAASMKEQVAAHKTNMMESEEQYVKLVEKEKDLAASAEELARRKEYEQAELDALREEAAQAKELSEGLPQQLQMLREQVKSEQAVLDAADGNLRDEEKVKNQTLEAHLGAAALYRERLGLRSRLARRRSADLLRARPSGRPRQGVHGGGAGDGIGRVRARGLRTRGGVLETSLTACNRTDNLSGFVRGARNAFRRVVAGGGGGGGGGDGEGGVGTPGMPEVDEPRPRTRNSACWVRRCCRCEREGEGDRSSGPVERTGRADRSSGSPPRRASRRRTSRRTDYCAYDGANSCVSL